MRRRWLAIALVVPLAGWDPFRTTDGHVDDGNRAFAQGHYDDAIHAYERVEHGVDRGGLDYDLGTARLKAADAEKDPKKKQQLHDDGLADLGHAAASAKDPRVRAQAAYNRGNALFADGKLDDAVASYKQALKENPALEDARLNLELALRHRKKEQQQQQQQGQGQGQGQQGQGQQQPPGQGQGQGQGQGSGQGQNPQPNGQGQGQGSGQGQGQPGQGSNQGSGQPGQGQGSNAQNPQQGQGQGSGSQDPNQQAPQPKLPGGHAGSGTGQQKTPGDENLDQLEGESRDQRRNQAQRRSNETYHPTDPEDW